MITVREPVICDTYTITAKEPDIAMRFDLVKFSV